MRRFLRTIAVVALFANGAAFAETAPGELVRRTTEDILSTIKADRAAYQASYQKLYDMADKKVLPHFDFQQMAKWVLGPRNWKAASEEQRKRFVTEFRHLLVRTYSTALLSYTDEEIIYLPVAQKPGEDNVMVKTEVKQKGGKPNVTVYYSFFRNKEGAWKVYDVTIEGVSLVTNYRAVYANKIRDQGMDALIASLVEENTKARK
jgi:phospholipid transport system substrate-binding protein